MTVKEFMDYYLDTEHVIVFSLTRSLDVNIQTVSIHVSLWRGEGDVSCLTVLHSPLPSVNTSIDCNGKQGFAFSL